MQLTAYATACMLVRAELKLLCASPTLLTYTARCTRSAQSPLLHFEPCPSARQIRLACSQASPGARPHTSCSLARQACAHASRWPSHLSQDRAFDGPRARQELA